MCSPNISSRSPRKSPSPCVMSRCGPSRGFLAGLAFVAAILCGWGPVVCGEALAQVERRQLPVLPGEVPPQPDKDFGVPAPSPPDQDFEAQPRPPGDQDFSPAETPPRAPAERWVRTFKRRRQPSGRAPAAAKARVRLLPISGAGSTGARSRICLARFRCLRPRLRLRACLRAHLPRVPKAAAR